MFELCSNQRPSVAHMVQQNKTIHGFEGHGLILTTTTHQNIPYHYIWYVLLLSLSFSLVSVAGHTFYKVSILGTF